MNLDMSKQKAGLIYDADGVTLLGKYADELSAHRAKRQWAEVLSSYFLLEKERDYDMWVVSDIGNGYFVRSCCFVSACWRYAFWRLINHQAPEAEQRLGGGSTETPAKRLLGSVKTGEEDKRWVFSALNDQIDENEYTSGLIDRIMKLFQ
ncbi:MAG: hypothetical protein KDD69_19130 [Bdellovibrionales bacterium]|nr:hypothetical protein [Bdellovibrionales bacterium]